MINHVQFPALGLEFTLNRVAFSLGGLDVYWYGIILALGLLAGMAFAFHYAVDDDSPVGQLPAGGCNAHELSSIVGSVHDEAGNHLVSPGYLILDDQAAR